MQYAIYLLYLGLGYLNFRVLARYCEDIHQSLSVESFTVLKLESMHRATLLKARAKI